MKIQLFSTPVYLVYIVTPDTNHGIKTLEGMIEAIRTAIEASGGTLKVKAEVIDFVFFFCFLFFVFCFLFFVFVFVSLFALLIDVFLFCFVLLVFFVFAPLCLTIAPLPPTTAKGDSSGVRYNQTKTRKKIEWWLHDLSASDGLPPCPSSLLDETKAFSYKKITLEPPCEFGVIL